MRQHTRPYRPKRQWRKERPNETSFQIEIVIEGPEGVANTFVCSAKPVERCSVCGSTSVGRAIKITGIASSRSWCEEDGEPGVPTTEAKKSFRKKYIGKSFCFGCLQG